MKPTAFSTIIFILFLLNLLSKIDAADDDGNSSSSTTLKNEYYRSMDDFLWPSAGKDESGIPYKMSASISDANRERIEGYMETIMIVTADCVHFREANENDTAYLHFITVAANVCDTTQIGYRKNQRSLIRLGVNADCYQSATVFRLLFHALGLYNEHQRPDRDKHVYVNYENVMKKCRQAFDIMPMDKRVLDEAYDRDSIMHWGNHACAKWPNVTTLEAIEHPHRGLGQSNSPTVSDYQKLTNLYCDGKKPFTFIIEQPKPEDIGLRSYIAGHMTVYLWPRGVIPFLIDDSFLNWQRKRMERAMQWLNEHTCIEFLEMDDDDTTTEDYIYFVWNPDGTSDGYATDVYGFQPGVGARKVELSETTFGNDGNTKMLYWALLAIIGITPEHRRPERDRFIAINWDNIVHGVDWAFQIYKPFDRRMLWTPYDMKSVMHPAPDIFSMWPQTSPSISSIDADKQYQVGSARVPTKSDFTKINNFYCYGFTTTTTSTTSTTTTTTTTTTAPAVPTTTPSEYYDVTDDDGNVVTTTTVQTRPPKKGQTNAGGSSTPGQKTRATTTKRARLRRPDDYDDTDMGEVNLQRKTPTAMVPTTTPDRMTRPPATRTTSSRATTSRRPLTTANMTSNATTDSNSTATSRRPGGTANVTGNATIDSSNSTTTAMPLNVSSSNTTISTTTSTPITTQPTTTTTATTTSTSTSTSTTTTTTTTTAATTTTTKAAVTAVTSGATFLTKATRWPANFTRTTTKAANGTTTTFATRPIRITLTNATTTTTSATTTTTPKPTTTSTATAAATTTTTAAAPVFTLPSVIPSGGGSSGLGGLVGGAGGRGVQGGVGGLLGKK